MLIYDARHVINTSNIITGYWNKIFGKKLLEYINIQFADICCCVILIFSLHIS